MNTKIKSASSRYRILFPRPDDKREEVKNVTHWIFSMNGIDFMVYYKDRPPGRSARESGYEFPPQWKYVNDRIKSPQPEGNTVNMK